MSVLETYEFMSIARGLLSDVSKSTNSLSEQEKNKLSSYFMNEASDYEIVHYLVNGTIPEEKYNSVKEALCCSIINSLAEHNSQFLTENFIDIIELTPLSEHSLSSSPIIAKFLVENNLIDEGFQQNILKAEIKKLEGLKKIPQYKNFPDAMKRLELVIADKKKKLASMLGESETITEGTTEASKKAAEKLKKGIANLTNLKSKGRLSASGENSLNSKKATLAKLQKGDPLYYVRKRAETGRKYGEALDDVAKARAKRAAELSTQRDLRTPEAKKEPILPNIKPKSKEEKPVGPLKSLAPKPKTEELTKDSSVKDSVNNLVSKYTGLYNKKTGFIIGGILLASMIAYAAYKRYKDMKDKYEPQCGRFSGEAKKACIRKVKIQATKAQIADLKKGMTVCSKTKDPAKCKAAIQKKIAKLQSKIGSVNESQTVFEEDNENKGIPKKDGSGKGTRANKGRGGCEETEEKGKGRKIPKED